MLRNIVTADPKIIITDTIVKNIKQIDINTLHHRIMPIRAV